MSSAKASFHEHWRQDRAGMRGACKRHRPAENQSQSFRPRKAVSRVNGSLHEETPCNREKCVTLTLGAQLSNASLLRNRKARVNAAIHLPLRTLHSAKPKA
uniref:Uncharacterized protein n=1 Tax=Rangifer tarandus platyrhynchus TaxID=3082113 RepID=A0ACB0E8W5_RANTA|nr:unnamed protein product [Rangifer tarandus platyrhynchus]